MMKPLAYIFDVFGTIVDWRTGVATQAKLWFERKDIDLDPVTFADDWRGKYQPAMQKIRSGNRGYVPLDILHRENLDELLEEKNLSSLFADSEREEFNRAWEKLPPWPDSVAGLQAIRQKAIIAPCSNGSIALMVRLAKYGSLPWDCIVGAEIARTYKPEPQAYLASCMALGLPPEAVVMVAAHNSDLEAARENGLQTAFIPRITEYGPDQTIDLSPTSEWDYIIESIGEL